MEPRIVFLTPKCSLPKSYPLECLIPNQCSAMEPTLPIATAINSSPPPSSSRLPPDGHEFPPNYQEPCPEPPDFKKPNEITEVDTKMQQPLPPLPCSTQPVATKRFRSNSVDDNENLTKFSNSISSVTEDITIKPHGRAGCWRNDEKSEKSVRDKIAMFSNVNDESPVSPCNQPAAIRKLNRFKSSEDVFYNSERFDTCNTLPSVKNLSRSVVSVDKVVPSTNQDSAEQSSPLPLKRGSSTYNSMLDVTEKQLNGTSTNPLNFVTRTQSSVDLVLSSSDCSSSAYSSCSPESSLSPTVSPSYAGYSSTLPRKHQTSRKTSLSSSQPPASDNKASLSRAMSFTVGSKLHSRSQSLVDVCSNNKYANSSIIKTNSEEARRASLNALIEQRRRSISKLRGLVIPEKVSEIPLMQQTIVDLPEIISKDSVLPSKKNISNFSGDRRSTTSNGKTGLTETCQNPNNFRQSTSSYNLMISSPPWKSESATVNDLPKYSPAFKRKSLAVYGISSSASSVSSSLSSSREELRPCFDNNSRISVSNNMLNKQVKSINQRGNVNYQHSDLYLSPSLQNNNSEPPKSLESITSPTRSDLSFEFVSSVASSPDVKMMLAEPEQDHVKTSQIDYESSNFNNNEPCVTPSIRTINCDKRYSSNSNCRRSGEESDNDSAVSSSRSSISHDFSPPASPLPDRNDHQRESDDDRSITSSDNQRMLVSPSNSTNSSDRNTLRRTLSSETTASAASSTGSTLTSGSQASCSSSGSDSSISRRVLKAQSVEAINRKNVLSSARFSSGQDLKVGSPLIRRKFENVSENDCANITDNGNGENFKDVENNNFMNTLNEKLRKDDRNNCDMMNPCDDIDKSVHYRLLSPSCEQSPNDSTMTKIAYLEVEVTDGPDSLSNEFESKYSDMSSGSASIDGMDFDCQLGQKISYNNGNDDKSDSETFKDDSLCNNSRRDSESTIEEIDFPSKPFVKRVTKESSVINPNNSHSSNSINNNKNNSNKSINNLGDNKYNIEERLKDIKKNNITVNNCKNSIRLASQTMGSKSKKDVYDDSDFFNKDCNKRDRINKTNENGGNSSSTTPARTIIGKHSVSVNDIRKAFEKAEVTSASSSSNILNSRSNSKTNGTTNNLNNSGSLNHIHARVSSLDSTTSEDSCTPTPTHYGSSSNLQKEQQFGSITSLASSTSLISQQELQQLIDDANQTLEETTGINSSSNHEVLVVILHRDTSGGSVGITLAGGADYEAKEITVHKVLAGSPADRDGRIQKGDRILSINGRSMKGITHRESLTILKAPRPEVVLVVSRWRPEGQNDSPEDPLVASIRNNLRPPRIPEQPVDLTIDQPLTEKDNVLWGPQVTVGLIKDGAGLGFSLEGGKDSPLGDMPLTIKKIFTGGCAEKSGQLFAGDELLAVNGTDVTSMSRIEAWSLMKRIADGKVKLNLRHRLNDNSVKCT